MLMSTFFFSFPKFSSLLTLSFKNLSLSKKEMLGREQLRMTRYCHPQTLVQPCSFFFFPLIPEGCSLFLSTKARSTQSSVSACMPRFQQAETYSQQSLCQYLLFSEHLQTHIGYNTMKTVEGEDKVRGAEGSQLSPFVAPSLG